MRILVITQKMDKKDTVLGFFHRWVEEFSKRYEKVIVICLYKGEYELPNNVKVLSLGKEDGVLKTQYILRFFKHILNEIKNYDVVFVHMNQEYVLLGAPIWKIFGKDIFMWRNHRIGNLFTRLASFLATKIFYTSPDSFTVSDSKAIKMPVGIDTNLFKPQNVIRKEKSILSIGRISPVKNIHLMIDVARILKDRGTKFTLDIVGDPVNPEDFKYKDKLLKEAQDLISAGILNFYPGVKSSETPKTYFEHEIFLNLTPSGSFDKTILEAATYGCVPFFNTKIGNQFGGVELTDLDPTKNANRIEGWFNAQEERKNEIRTQLQKYVLENHSLSILFDKLKKEIS